LVKAAAQAGAEDNQIQTIRLVEMEYLPKETAAAKEAQVVPIHHREVEAVVLVLLVTMLVQISINAEAMAVLV
jgi:hypothetical protein